MNHKNSTYMLIFLFFIVGIGFAISIDSSDVDEICNQNNNFLFRYNGYWGCGNISGVEINISFNNITNLYVNTTDFWDNYDTFSQAILENRTKQVYFGDNVGIGTDSPVTKLDVDGSIATDANLYFTSSDHVLNDWHIGYDVANTGLEFTETGVAANRLFLHDGGNIGIGTASPGEKLEVNGKVKLNVAAGSTLLWFRSGTSDTKIGQVQGQYAYIDAQDSQDIRFFGNSNLRMIIENTGNVGIGTASPTHGFNNYGTTNLSGNTLVEGDLDVTGNLDVGKNFTLQDTVWEDLRFPVTSIKVGSTKPPAFDEANWTYNFDDTSEEQLYVIIQMPHARKSKTNLSAHFHWQPYGGDTDIVRWCMEYVWANFTYPFGGLQTICTDDYGNTNPSMHMVTDDLVIDGAGMYDSAIIKARIYRDADDVADNYTGDAGLIEFDLHYEIDKLGSDAKDGDNIII